MDIITHAVVGAFTGAVYDRPVLGAMAAVVPDAALWLRPRLPSPPALYRAAHGALLPLVITAALLPLFGPSVAIVVFLSWTSHIVLDIPTHGEKWSPRLFWPLDVPIFTEFEEWEWFSESWHRGLEIALIWIFICIVILSFGIGSPS